MDLHIDTKDPSGDRLRFTYISEKASITGQDAERVKRMIALADGIATLPGGWPAMPAPDPLSNPADMALFLAGNEYELPPALGELLPELQDDLPEGAIA